MLDPRALTLGYDSHVLTQHALTIFKIKNRKDSVSYGSLNIYNIVCSVNILYSFSIIIFPHVLKYRIIVLGKNSRKLF
jgi:hypothetical protein